jgi:hypothetical protein
VFILIINTSFCQKRKYLCLNIFLSKSILLFTSFHFLKLYEDGDVNKDLRKRLITLRNQMRIRASVQGAEIDAYIVTSFDEHQTERTAPDDRRREFISGFTGDIGDAVVGVLRVSLCV